MDYVVYGAKSLALGMYKAIQYLHPEWNCRGFVVSNKKGNPELLSGEKVWQLEELKSSLSLEEQQQIKIFIATPEDLHREIANYLEENGFQNYECMNSVKEAKLMEQYYTEKKLFPSLHELPAGDKVAKLKVYQAKFYRDKVLTGKCELPDWVVPIQVGAELTGERVAQVLDNTGEHISSKNVNYCEMTALYWLWKNGMTEECDYYGLFHYRRILDVSEEDLRKMEGNNVDVIVQFPTMHEPNIYEHHERYIKEGDWEAMLQALQELHPEYAKALPEIFSQEYFYNYNMIIAKKEVLNNYCSWLFPVLERTEQLSTPKGWERRDRYIGYLAENLMTLYLMYHKNDLNVVHTGRIMLT